MNNDTLTDDSILKSSRTFSLKQLFENNYFYVPDYQRGYSWEEEQLEDLLRDIDNISKLGHGHFTGTIVAAKDASVHNLYELVDGQQRLTTLVVLLICINRQFSNKFPEIENLYIQRGDIGNENLVFVPNAETKECYREAIVFGQIFEASIKSHECLIFAREYFNAWLDENKDRIDDIYETITTKLNFLFFTPQKDNEIGIMFEVINNRGKRLSELEKIKNYFIYYSTVNSKKTLRDSINTYWTHIQTNLSHAGKTSNDAENIFLRNCYLVYFESNKDKSWHVYDRCKENFDVKEQDDNYIENAVKKMQGFISFLASSSRYYGWFYNQKFFQSSYKGENRDNLDKVLLYLRCQPINASIMPLYLAVMDRLKETEQVIELLHLIEKVNMRLYILPNIFKRADSKQGEMFSLATQFFKKAADKKRVNNSEASDLSVENDDFGWLKQCLIEFTLEYCPSDKLAESLKLSSDDDYDFYRWVGLRYMLGCYEEKIQSKRAKRTFYLSRILSGRKAVGDNLNDHLSVEHIWASKNRVEDFPENHHIKRRLGNFVLCGLSSNISLSDKGIDEKIKMLLKKNAISYGSMDMVQVDDLPEFLDKSTADVQQIYKKRVKNYWRDLAGKLADRRENSLVIFALDRWKLPGDKKLKQYSVASEISQ